VLVAVGAILEWGVTANTTDRGFNIHTVGLILLVVGVVGFLLSLMFWGARGFGGWYGPRRHRTMIDDGAGRVIRREDQYS
jgi:hypothetical protein